MVVLAYLFEGASSGYSVKRLERLGEHHPEIEVEVA